MIIFACEICVFFFFYDCVGVYIVLWWHFFHYFACTWNLISVSTKCILLFTLKNCYFRLCCTPTLLIKAILYYRKAMVCVKLCVFSSTLPDALFWLFMICPSMKCLPYFGGCVEEFFFINCQIFVLIDNLCWIICNTKDSWCCVINCIIKKYCWLW